MTEQPSEKVSKSVEEESRGFGLEFFMMNLGNFLILTGSVMFVLLPDYLQSHGMDKWKIGLVDGSFWLISIFVQPWLGPRLDREGRKRYLLLGSGMMALAAACYPFIPIHLAPMIVARLVHGFGFACYLTASWTWVADYAPSNRIGEFFGIFGISGMISGAIGPGIAEYLVAEKSYENLFFYGGGFILVGLFALLGIKDRRPTGEGHKKAKGFFRLLRSVAMRGTAIGSIAFGVGMGSIFAFIAPYLSTLDIEGVGPLFACTTLASGASRVYAGRQTDQLGPAKLVAPALFLLAAGAFGLAQVAYSGEFALPVLVGSGLTAGLGYGVVYPALNAVAIRRLDEASRGRGLSLVTAAIDCGSFSGAFLAGLVSHHLGYPAGFRAIAALVIALLLCFLMAEKQITKREATDR